MSVTNRLWLVLLDGEEHHARDCLDFLAAAVAPQVAVKEYMRNRNRDNEVRGRPAFDPATVPAEAMLATGRRRVVVNTIRSAAAKGLIALTRHADTHGQEADPDDFSLRLTEAGRAHLFPPKKPVALGGALNELRRLLAQGTVTVRVTPSRAAFATNFQEAE